MRPGPDPEQSGGTGPDAALEQALALARRGDEAGFATLWRALHPPLLRYLAVRDRPGATSPEDIAGETWFQVVRDLGSFAGGCPRVPGVAVHGCPAPRDRRGPGRRGSARGPRRRSR